MTARGEAIIHIVNKFKVKKQNQAFRCIMIYQDVETEFCIIRPLLHKIDLEIVMELYKIFTSYGPPSKLLVNSCTSEMVENMEAHMKTFCPMFNVKFTKNNEDRNKILMKVVERLHEWMKKTNKDEWEIGCFIVQRQINTEVSAVSRSQPQELFFKHSTYADENLNESENVLQEQQRSSSQEQKTVNREQIAFVSQEHNVAKVTCKQENSVLSDSLGTGTVKIKEEVQDFDDNISIKDRMVLFDGGLIFTSKKPDTHIEVKMERLDEE